MHRPRHPPQRQTLVLRGDVPAVDRRRDARRRNPVSAKYPATAASPASRSRSNTTSPTGAATPTKPPTRSSQPPSPCNHDFGTAVTKVPRRLGQPPVLAAQLKPDGSRSRLLSHRSRASIDAAVHRHAGAADGRHSPRSAAAASPGEAVASSPRARALPQLVQGSSDQPAPRLRNPWPGDSLGGRVRPSLPTARITRKPKTASAVSRSRTGCACLCSARTTRSISKSFSFGD